MIVEDCVHTFLEGCVRRAPGEAAREHNALVELMGKSLSSHHRDRESHGHGHCFRVDGIILEYTGSHKIDERINEAGKEGIPVVTVLKDAPDTSHYKFCGGQ